MAVSYTHLDVYKRQVLDLLCAAFTTVCELVFPLIVRFITDLGLNDMESLTVQLVLSVGAFYLVLRVIDTLSLIHI